MKTNRVNLRVFLPAFILLLFVFLISYFYPTSFSMALNKANAAILSNFAWLIVLLLFFSFVVLIVVTFSPLGRIRIGGENAKPILKGYELFSISLCAAIAGSILYWGFAEPLLHFYNPPAVLGIEPGSETAAKFALSATAIHWGILPIALNCISVIAFAYSFFNKKKSFSLEQPLSLAFSKNRNLSGVFVNVYCIVAFACALIAALALGILSLSGGVTSVSGNELFSSVGVKIAICGILVVAYTASSVSGLKKGIRILSNFNLYIYIGILIYLLITCNPAFILNLSVESLGYHISNFFEQALMIDSFGLDTWAQDWTVFSYAVCIAFTPLTAMFLCRVFYGRTIREIVLYEFVYANLFTFIWIFVLGSATISTEMSAGGLLAVSQKGTEFIAYEVLGRTPLGKIIQFIFLFTYAISFITAADSTTNAMAAVSSKGIRNVEDEPSIITKVLWGVIIGAIAGIVAAFSGLSGIRAAGNIGGIATIAYELLLCIGLLKEALTKRT